MKKYPDITELLKQKAAHRRALAALPFEQKIEMVFRLKARREAMQAARAATLASKARVKKRDEKRQG